jgi:5-methylcytosine-specific restriction endonuclease McrA
MAFFVVNELPGKRFSWHGRMPMDSWIPLKQYVFARDEGICQYCLQPVPYEESHCHHALELQDGGTNHPSNLKTLCVDCHKIRHPFMRSARDKSR